MVLIISPHGTGKEVAAPDSPTTNQPTDSSAAS